MLNIKHHADVLISQHSYTASSTVFFTQSCKDDRLVAYIYRTHHVQARQHESQHLERFRFLKGTCVFSGIRQTKMPLTDRHKFLRIQLTPRGYRMCKEWLELIGWGRGSADRWKKHTLTLLFDSYLTLPLFLEWFNRPCGPLYQFAHMTTQTMRLAPRKCLQVVPRS